MTEIEHTPRRRVLLVRSRENSISLEGFIGIVVGRTPNHLEGTGRSQKLRPLVTIRIEEGLVEFPIGFEFWSIERPNQLLELVDVTGDEVTLMITKGMGRGRSPSPGAVPEMGERVTFHRPPVEVESLAIEEDEHGEPLLRVVSMNQIVAWNIAYWRRQLGFTQEELGQMIARHNGGVPWSKANVSAAERTWEGVRARRFDIDDVVMFAKVFDLPIAAFLLPPDDGIKYVAGSPDHASGEESYWDAEDLIDKIIPFSPLSSPDQLGAYAQRFAEFVDDGLGEGAYRQFLGNAHSISRYPAVHKEKQRIESHIEALEDVIADLRTAHTVLAEEEREEARVTDRISQAQHPSQTREVLGHYPEIDSLYKAGRSLVEVAAALGLTKYQVVQGLVLASTRLRPDDTEEIRRIMAEREEGQDDR
ncbi:helix-turn-helix domain-containing protein [Nonomuraea endophytica]|uniref:helix-turn-helix domain-containing protein n=1 Tax=Nonomuraea endophytica TaxID=714136 RepID=UPI0037C835E8